MDSSLGVILTGGALVIGLLILTGNGAVFLKGGKEEQRKKIYDQRRFELATGVMLLVFALLTGIDCFTKGSIWKVAYVIATILTFALYVVALRRWCKLPEGEAKQEKTAGPGHIVKNTKNYKK